MTNYKPAELSQAEFSFCKYGSLILLWIAIFTGSKILIGILTFTFFISMLFKINYSPLILLFRYSVGLLIGRSSKILVNEKDMRFSHTVAFYVYIVALIFLLFINIGVGWGILVILGILKVIGLFGKCPSQWLKKILIKKTKKGCCCNSSDNCKS